MESEASSPEPAEIKKITSGNFSLGACSFLVQEASAPPDRETSAKFCKMEVRPFQCVPWVYRVSTKFSLNQFDQYLTKHS